jgi:ferric-dicitrate binding protein FerR (iron transport regulator)
MNETQDINQMEYNKENMNRIDTDKAWNVLHERLEKEHLLTTYKKGYSYKKKRIIHFQRIAAVAAICAGFIITVFYFSQKKDIQWVVIKNTEKTGTLVTTLEDGSTVYLASDASISYPMTFAKNNREIELNGNALFYIAKDEKHPFVVMTNEITIEVVGTIFAIQSSFDNLFELSVKEGKVNVRSKDSQTWFMVEAEETVQLNENGLSKSKTMNWQILGDFTDKLCFKDEKLNNIVQTINSIHGVPILITEESLNNRSLTVTFENNTVETMTELICLALNLEYIGKQDTIFIRPLLK